MTLLNQVFELQRKIDAIRPEGYECVDAGMFIPEGSESELWRDNTLEKGDVEYSFSFSTKGGLVGDVPPEMVLELNLILGALK